MKQTALLAILLALLIGTSSCAHRKRVVYEPTPIASSEKSSAKVKAGIKQALSTYGWIIEKDESGQMIAKQTRGSHNARVKIRYSSKEVKVSYLDSENLNYHIDRNGMARIHGRYNTWVQNLERAIAANVG